MMRLDIRITGGEPALRQLVERSAALELGRYGPALGPVRVIVDQSCCDVVVAVRAREPIRVRVDQHPPTRAVREALARAGRDVRRQLQLYPGATGRGRALPRRHA